MSGSCLTIDRGNTSLDCMLHGVGARRQRLDPEDAAGLAAFVGLQPPRTCIGATVVPAGLDAVERLLVARGCRLEVVGRDRQCPLRLDYATPQTLGADRWLGALAAWRRFGRSVTVDCGSATTVNLVDADGTFRGGAIAPGLRALQAGMRAVTPHLPAADAAAMPILPARSSQAGVDAGLLLGWCGLVERLVGDLLQVAGGAATVVLTGGNAAILQRHGRLPLAVAVDDLVHQGLRLLASGDACGC